MNTLSRRKDEDKSKPILQRLSPRLCEMHV